MGATLELQESIVTNAMLILESESGIININKLYKHIKKRMDRGIFDGVLTYLKNKKLIYGVGKFDITRDKEIALREKLNLEIDLELENDN